MRSFLPFYSLLFLLCSLGTGISWAQGTFISFDYPYLEVQQMLYNRPAVKVLFEQENTQISVQHNDAITTFYFEKGVLYNVDETRSFTKAKDAEVAYDQAMNYLLEQHIMPIDFCKDATGQSVIGTLDDKIYRLIIRPNDVNGIDVILSCKNVHLAPLRSLEGVDFMGFGEHESHE